MMTRATAFHAYLGQVPAYHGCIISVSPSSSFVRNYYPHFTQQEPETQRPSGICPKTTQLVNDKGVFGLGFSDVKK